MSDLGLGEVKDCSVLEPRSKDERDDSSEAYDDKKAQDEFSSQRKAKKFLERLFCKHVEETVEIILSIIIQINETKINRPRHHARSTFHTALLALSLRQVLQSLRVFETPSLIHKMAFRHKKKMLKIQNLCLTKGKKSYLIT
jgi:hypothetical protein